MVAPMRKLATTTQMPIDDGSCGGDNSSCSGCTDSQPKLRPRCHTDDGSYIFGVSGAMLFMYDTYGDDGTRTPSPSATRNCFDAFGIAPPQTCGTSTPVKCPSTCAWTDAVPTWCTTATVCTKRELLGHCRRGRRDYRFWRCRVRRGV